MYISKVSTPDLMQIQIPNHGLQRLSRLGCEADHSSPLTAKINSEWNYTSSPPVGLHEVFKQHY